MDAIKVSIDVAHNQVKWKQLPGHVARGVGWGWERRRQCVVRVWTLVGGTDRQACRQAGGAPRPKCYILSTHNTHIELCPDLISHPQAQLDTNPIFLEIVFSLIFNFLCQVFSLSFFFLLRICRGPGVHSCCLCLLCAALRNAPLL